MPFPPKTTGSPIRAKVVGQYRDELLPLLSEYPVEILDTDSSETPGLVFSYGGDGTLLGAERDFPGIPKLPLRDKSHNPRCQRHCERQCLDAFFEGRIALTEYMKLRASVHGRELTALNDIVLERRLHPLGAIRFQASVNGGAPLPRVIADALVIATPYGSTGYFKSITRGAFERGIGLAYSNPIDGEQFLVVGEDSSISVKILRGPAILQTGNSPKGVELTDGDEFTIAAAREKARIYGLDEFRCQECYNLRRMHGRDAL